MSYRTMDLSGLGQTEPAASPIRPLLYLAGGLFVLSMVGAKSAERHQQALYANKGRRRRSRRR